MSFTKKILHIRYFLFFTLLFKTILSYSQVKDEEYFINISKALGYSYGIEYSNSLIIEKLPELSKKALLCQSNFDIAHGKAIKEMEREVEENMDLSISDFKQSFIDMMSGQIYNVEDIKSEFNDFLENFDEERIKGNNELYEPFVKILLQHNPLYKIAPAKEFTDGYIQLFQSDNHPKSKNLNISLEFPKSWTGREGKRPNVMSLYKSYNGYCMVTVSVVDNLEEMQLSSQLSVEDKEYFSSDEFINESYNEISPEFFGKDVLKEYGLNNISDYSFDKIQIDGNPSLKFSAAGNIKNIIGNIEVYMISCLIYYKNFTINVCSMITMGQDFNNEKINLSENKAKYKMLCNLIINSLIIKNKYKEKYDFNYKEEYLKICKENLIAENYSSNSAIEYCNCTLEKIKENNISYKELLEIENENKKAYNEILLPCTSKLENNNSRYEPNDIDGYGSQTLVKLIPNGNTFKLKLTFGEVERYFTLDTGADELIISGEMEKKLLAMGLIENEKSFEKENFELADGSIVEGKKIIISNLIIGGYQVNNVIAYVVSEGNLLCGMGFLNKFKKWNIDRDSKNLILTK